MGRYGRRDFLKSTAGVVTAGAFTGLLTGCQDEAQCCSKSKWEGFKYSMCNESMMDLPFSKQCEIISSAGYTGIELAPFTLVEESVDGISGKNREIMSKIIEQAGLKCVGLHWLLSPPPKGLHFTTPDKKVRERTVAYLNSLIDFCGDLGGEVMIFGSPNQRGAKGFSIDEAKRNFADGMAKVAEHARQRNVKILIEPLDKSQTNVINTTAEAVEIIDKVYSQNIQTMFDFHNTVDEKLALDKIIKKYYQHIFHVHVQEMDGRHMGTGTGVKDYVKAFQTLKDFGYSKWVSLEVFDFTPGGEVIANESMKALKEIESKLI